MKWSIRENRMLSVLETPFIKKDKKGFYYYFCNCWDSKPIYI